ncbi:MAG TPA: GNAT family N-acetyltransferase [Planktothrix sp.]|jgi:predicted acetyltransferase
MKISLVTPNSELLPSYIEAISEGKYCNMALGGFADDAVEAIERDRHGYLRKITNTCERKVRLPDGAEYTISDQELFWITDGTRFLGTVSIRYSGDAELIDLVAGHIGMAIRPSLLNQGYGVRAASEAWVQIKERMRDRGITHIIATCDPENRASKRLIEHNGGKLVQESKNLHGMGDNLTYRIELPIE